MFVSLLNQLDQEGTESPLFCYRYFYGFRGKHQTTGPPAID
jgi:hypothetical protein